MPKTTEIEQGEEENTTLTIVIYLSSVAAAPSQSQLKPGAEPSLAEAQPGLPSDDSHISASSGSG